MPIAFCVGVKQAYRLAEEFRSYGVEAQAVDGAMDRDERDERIKAFRQSAYPVLTNCMIATEGFDVPDVDTILMARPTKSTPLYTQMVGRGTRPVINPTDTTAAERCAAIQLSRKPCMRIIDFTDNTGKHPVVTAPGSLAWSATSTPRADRSSRRSRPSRPWKRSIPASRSAEPGA